MRPLEGYRSKVPVVLEWTFAVNHRISILRSNWSHGYHNQSGSVHKRGGEIWCLQYLLYRTKRLRIIGGILPYFFGFSQNCSIHLYICSPFVYLSTMTHCRRDQRWTGYLIIPSQNLLSIYFVIGPCQVLTVGYSTWICSLSLIFWMLAYYFINGTSQFIQYSIESCFYTI